MKISLITHNSNLSAINIALIFLLFACQTEKKLDPANQIISQLKQQFAPDKRVAIFNITPRYESGTMVLSGETNIPEAKDSLLNTFQKENIAFVDSIQLLPQVNLEGKTYGIVRLSVCNIRSKPKDSAELSTQATLGTPITIYKKQGDWFYIQTPDGYLGWLYKGGFTWMDQNEFQAWQSSDLVVYLPEMGFSYQHPDINSGVVSDLLAGNILRQVRTEANFTQVTYPDGRIAYLPAAELMPLQEWLASQNPTPEKILQTARQWMGRPYLWGGTSGKAVDCSGFTKSVFFLNGLLLPRDASQQVHVGKAIETDTTLKNLQPGDFLFFGTPATAEKSERIRHVAIYMGDGKIIHASELVKIESLRRGDPNFAEERLKTFIRAKRMLATPQENGVPFLSSIAAYNASI